jgi:hypothetical protein
MYRIVIVVGCHHFAFIKGLKTSLNTVEPCPFVCLIHTVQYVSAPCSLFAYLNEESTD